jgi:hypothetical protein
VRAQQRTARPERVVLMNLQRMPPAGDNADRLATVTPHKPVRP